MGWPALAAPYHLHYGAAISRYHRHVLSLGAARTRRRSLGRLDREKIRAGAAAAEHRGSRSDRRLQTAAAARRRAGKRSAGDGPFRTVYIGSFIRGVDKVEEEFHARAAELGMAEDVIVSGYVASDHEVFGLFSEIDAFCYPLEEGLTARRGSILACVQSGRPIIVTGPAEQCEFDHHPRFKELIDRGAIVLVARGSGEEVYADRIASALKRPSVQAPFDFDGWWQDVAQAVRAQL
jgi:hypothetical protein